MSAPVPHGPGSGEASPWVTRWAHLVRPGGSVLDVACGGGRHARWFARRGWRVTAVDVDAAAVAALPSPIEGIVADLEDGAWPFEGRRFDAVVVTNYLWRPLMPTLLGALAESGVLIHETFAAGHESVGRPRSPAFLLAPGELIELTAGLRVVAYEDGFLEAPERFVQRIVAVREAAEAPAPARHHLRRPEPQPAG
ncbi:methyltransferase domain-containing protein [Piscinibacter koreensis]|uniref:Class I SAM-dependent methyltransferase n=1 Tax=Piscinibacter koreensis TaxID=2742824 RepID=A0A7Y6TVK8_9BURK|nr:class I SAM-dependent methyltransferase [Schlegelella koreensis]